MGDRLAKLKKLEVKLYESMRDADPRTLAPLAKQYRETVREIEEIEGDGSTEDAITKVLSAREADGKSGTVCKNRARISRD